MKVGDDTKIVAMAKVIKEDDEEEDDETEPKPKKAEKNSDEQMTHRKQMAYLIIRHFHFDILRYI